MHAFQVSQSRVNPAERRAFIAAFQFLWLSSYCLSTRTSHNYKPARKKRAAMKPGIIQIAECDAIVPVALHYSASCRTDGWRVVRHYLPRVSHLRTKRARPGCVVNVAMHRNSARDRDTFARREFDFSRCNGRESPLVASSTCIRRRAQDINVQRTVYPFSHGQPCSLFLVKNRWSTVDSEGNLSVNSVFCYIESQGELSRH